MLSRIPNLIKDSFPENWHSNYNFSTNDECEDAKEKINAKLIALQLKIFDAINRSLLSGEYINYISKESEIKNLENALPVIEFDKLPLGLALYFENQCYEYFVSPVKISLRNYQNLLRYLDRKYELDFWYIQYDFTSKPIFGQDVKLYDSEKLFDIVSYNIKLCKIDHSLCFGQEDIIKELLIIKTELESLQATLRTLGYLKLLIDKCKFLIKKILYRIGEDEKNYLYIHNYQDKEISTDNLQIEFFKSYDAISSKHKDGTNGNYFPKSEIDKIRKKINEDHELTFLEYYCAIKHYKDIKPNVVKLKNVNQKFRSAYHRLVQSKISKFDINSYRISLNYFKNNELSILIESDASESAIEQILHEVIEIQEETGVRNFFPFKKHALYLKGRIDTIFRSQEVNLKEASKLIEKLEVNISLAYKSYEWCKDRNFIAFQLPLSECSIQNVICQNESYNLFIASSFILPLNYESVRIELDQLTRDLERYKSLLAFGESISYERETVKKLQSEIKNYDKRSIEILGVFAAIVLFTSGSLKIFENKFDIKTALIFMLTFSSSLALFVFLLWIITLRTDVKIKTIQRATFLLFVVFEYFLLAKLLEFWPFIPIGI